MTTYSEYRRTTFSWLKQWYPRNAQNHELIGFETSYDISSASVMVTLFPSQDKTRAYIHGVVQMKVPMKELMLDSYSSNDVAHVTIVHPSDRIVPVLKKLNIWPKNGYFVYEERQSTSGFTLANLYRALKSKDSSENEGLANHLGTLAGIVDFSNWIQEKVK